MNNTPIWEGGGWLGFERLTETTRAELCVVGLGGSGLAAMMEALGSGITVVGIDAGVVAGGAAGRNGGFLLAGAALFYHEARSTYGPKRAAEFYQATIDEIDRFYETRGTRNTGSLRIASSDAELGDIEAEYGALTQDGFDVEWYEGPEGSGIMMPWDGVCNPMARVRDIACEAADAGAALYEHTPAVSIETGLVTTELGAVECDNVLVAVDGGLELVFPGLAGRVRTASLQMLASEPDDGVSLTRPVYTEFGHVYYQQLPDGSVALGGRRDRHPDVSWTTETGTIPEIQSDLTEVLRRIGVTAPVRHRWAGSAAFTEDRRPVFDEILPGVVAIGAYSGHGNVVGAIYGKEAVRQIKEGRPIVPPL